jgi:hypothetical protein
VWIGKCALCVSFPNLFEIRNQKEWSVCKSLNNGCINLTFRRSFDVLHKQEWAELSAFIEGVSLNDLPDSVRWCLDRKEVFTTASLYRGIFYTGFDNR